MSLPRWVEWLVAAATFFGVGLGALGMAYVDALAPWRTHLIVAGLGFILLGLLIVVGALLEAAKLRGRLDYRVRLGRGLELAAKPEFSESGVRFILYTRPRPIKRGLCVTTDQEVSDVVAIVRQRQADGLYSTEVPSAPCGRSAIVYATNLDDATLAIYRTRIDIALKTSSPPRRAYVRHATKGDYKKLEALPSANKLRP